MQNSQQFLKQENILPRLSFRDGKRHILTLVKDKIDSISNDKGQQIKGVRYLCTEDGTPKSFFTSSQALIQRLAEVPEESVVAIQMKRRQTPQGFRSYFEIDEEQIDEEFKTIPETEQSGGTAQMDYPQQE